MGRGIEVQLDQAAAPEQVAVISVEERGLFFSDTTREGAVHEDKGHGARGSREPAGRRRGIDFGSERVIEPTNYDGLGKPGISDDRTADLGDIDTTVFGSKSGDAEGESIRAAPRATASRTRR